MDYIEELARLGKIIHDRAVEPEGIERFSRLDDDQIKELLKDVNDFYQSGELSNWRTYYFARLCLQYIINKRKEQRNNERNLGKG